MYLFVSCLRLCIFGRPRAVPRYIRYLLKRTVDEKARSTPSLLHHTRRKAHMRVGSPSSVTSPAPSHTSQDTHSNCTSPFWYSSGCVIIQDCERLPKPRQRLQRIFVLVTFGISGGSHRTRLVMLHFSALCVRPGRFRLLPRICTAPREILQL